jgi:hypothetical protein
MRLARQQWVLMVATALLAGVLVVVLATGGNRPAAQEIKSDADQACRTLADAEQAFATGTEDARRTGMELLDQAVRTVRITVGQNGAYAPILVETDAAHRLSHEVGLDGHAQVSQAIAAALRACAQAGVIAEVPTADPQ